MRVPSERLEVSYILALKLKRSHSDLLYCYFNRYSEMIMILSLVMPALIDQDKL